MSKQKRKESIATNQDECVIMAKQSDVEKVMERYKVYFNEKYEIAETIAYFFRCLDTAYIDYQKKMENDPTPVDPPLTDQVSQLVDDIGLTVMPLLMHAIFTAYIRARDEEEDVDKPVSPAMEDDHIRIRFCYGRKIGTADDIKVEC